MSTESPKLLDSVRDAIRTRHYSRRTEETYVNWIKRFIFFHKKRHPASMGADEVNAFLSTLATRDHVSATTQNQALSAILFLYRVVLRDPLPWIEDIVRATRPERVPVVMTPSEARLVIEKVEGTSRLVAQLLYGSGVRLLECLQLRVKDLDFGRREVLVRDPKGRRDRVTTLPERIEVPLRAHLEKVRRVHDADLSLGFGSIALPTAINRKFPTRIGTGCGSGCFRRKRAIEIQWQASNAATICTNRPCSEPCTRRRRRRESRSA